MRRTELQKLLDGRPLEIRCFTAFTPDDTPLSAELIEKGGDLPRQKVGTLGLVNDNGQEVAVGALAKWLRSNNRAPMFVQHNTTVLPAGSWRDFDLQSGTDLYARPYVTIETSGGRDVLASIEAGDVRGISWTVRPRSWEDIEYRERKGNEPKLYGILDEVMVVTDGILREISVVDRPADKSARFRSRKVGSTTGKTPGQSAQARRLVARSLAHRAHRLIVPQGAQGER